ncbi:MAG: hypothetical protein KF778_17050 [Rhodocyclaceae bacterium]|nr:hypothetical protein [Rhodocyclaceae bacterium]
MLDTNGLDADGVAQWSLLIELATRVCAIDVSVGSFAGNPPDDGSDFAFVTDSTAFTRKILLNVPLIYVAPGMAPRRIDPWFYRKAQESGTQAGSWQAGFASVTLISSIFRGDEYLPGFLENCAGLQGYTNIAHLLVRAASPGQEHARLIEHARRWPAAVYLNLAQDPGLYEVWNLGTRLATSRYLSNANIDDRRAPTHVAHLQTILDNMPEVDTASTALRISSTRNLSWENSNDCPTLYADGGDQKIAVDGLFRRSPQGWRSRNLPHCMPLWRRSLHARVGHFDETCYGGSADWAFWVNAGLRGSAFHLRAEALGLYLRDAHSYWHRDGSNTQIDERIIEHYQAAAEAGSQRMTSQHSASRELGDAIDLLRAAAVIDGLGRLLDAAAREDCAGQGERALVNKAAEQYFGCANFADLTARYRAVRGPGRQADTDVFNVCVDLVHGLDAATPTCRRMLELAAIDLAECIDQFSGSCLLALLARKLGNMESERSLLRQLHASGSGQFWKTVQRVYRFSVPLADLCETVASVLPHSPSTQVRAPIHLGFYPSVSGNAYLDLLYGPLRRSQGTVWGTTDETVFLDAAPRPKHENILHVHWINRMLWPMELKGKSIQQRCDAFLAGLEKQKQRGFRIFWTIHNRLSHETASVDAEVAFRRALYDLADRVFIHHPLAADLLDWLPDRSKLCLCEHGPYDMAAAGAVSRAAARGKLGLAPDDFVLAHIGQIRDYKGLDAVLPILPALLDAIPHLKILIAGRIQSHAVKVFLKENAHRNLIVHDGHLNNADLLYHMRAADVGLLSYGAVLTSGSLFHWLSAGRPVLAPMVGTLPAYVVDGWNGYGYRDSNALRRLLEHCARLPGSEIERMGANALATAQGLDWSMWKQ